MQFSKTFLGLAAAALLVTAGCAQQKAPANKALESIEATLKDVRDDAAKYAPDGLKGVESQLARLKESYDKKEYDNVLAGTPELDKAVNSLKDAVASGKKHAAEALAVAKSEWESLNAEVPKMVENIQTRVDEGALAVHLRVGDVSVPISHSAPPAGPCVLVDTRQPKR